MELGVLHDQAPKKAVFTMRDAICEQDAMEGEAEPVHHAWTTQSPSFKMTVKLVPEVTNVHEPSKRALPELPW